MKRLALWIIVLVSNVTVLSLLAIYRAPPSLSDFVGPQFAVGFLLGGSSLALVFLIGDWWDGDEKEP
jgi:hypothetical protein